MSKTEVTVGDQDVVIRETDTGFEAVPVSETEPEPGLYLKFRSGSYGGMVPIDADIELTITPDFPNTVGVAWDTDDHVGDDDMRSDGWDGAEVDGLDGHASIRVDTVEVVTVE